MANQLYRAFTDIPAEDLDQALAYLQSVGIAPGAIYAWATAKDTLEEATEMANVDGVEGWTVVDQWAENLEADREDPDMIDEFWGDVRAALIKMGAMEE